MRKTNVTFTLLIFLLLLLALSQPAYAHNLEKHSGKIDVKSLLAPDDDLSTWEHWMLYSVNGLLVLFSIILISMLIRRKKPGKILVFFLLLLVADYAIVVHYGSLLDLIG